MKWKQTQKKLASFTVALSMAMGMVVPAYNVTTVNATTAAATTATTTVSEESTTSADTATTENEYNYARAFQQTLMFYEFQMSGKIDGLCRNNWRGDCDLEDGSDVGLDLTGGWHDAGDHVKFNLPMCYSATMLAWSYIEYEDTYKESGQDKYMLQQLRWVNDYFIKCHPEKYVYYYQVGDGDIDHQLWTAPELFDEYETMVRPSFKLDLEHGGSAVCAGTAASLAAAAIIFKESDPEYAELCLKHADELYEFALITKTDLGYSCDNGNTKNEDKIQLTEEESKVYQKAAGYYTSSHFQDELTWGGAWLYKATGEQHYLDTAKSFAYEWGGEKIIGNLKGNTWTQCWDDVRYGAMLLIAQLDESEEAQDYRDGIEYNLDYMSTGTEDGARNKRTPGGLVMINDWGSLRYAAAAAFMAMLYVNWEDADPNRVEAYKEFAKSQADYILGSTGRSYIVGYDETSPVNPHHRAAHGAYKNSPLGYPDTNRHSLIGALVGGPRADESYEDDRNNYCTNEVSCDYNAGALGLMCAMYDEYGGTIDPDMNAYEEAGQEFEMSAGLYQHGEKDGGSYFEIKNCVVNMTAWPARVTTNLKYRVYVDISDVLEAGYTTEDFFIISYYSQYMPAQEKVSELLPYDEEKGIYYIEVDLSGAELTPSGDVIGRNDMQLLIKAPCEWDYFKSPSLQPILDTDGDHLIPDNRICVYEGDELVYGYEPNMEIPEEEQITTTQNANQTTANSATTGVAGQTTQNSSATTGAAGQTTQNSSVTTGAAGQTTQNPQATTGTAGQTTEEADSSAQEIPVKGLALHPEEITIAVGQNAMLQPVFTPLNATNQNLTWRNGNASVLQLDEDGKITALKAGETNVFAIAEDGSYFAKCKVNVVASQEQEGTVTTQGASSGSTTSVDANRTTAGVADGTTNAQAGNSTGNATTATPNDSNSNGTQDSASNTASSNSDSTQNGNSTGITSGTSSSNNGATTGTQSGSNINGATNGTGTANDNSNSAFTGTTSDNVSAGTNGSTGSNDSNASTANGSDSTATNTIITENKILTNNELRLLYGENLKKVTGLKKTKVKATSFTLKWKKQSDITGYCVYRYNTITKKFNLVKKVSAKKNGVVIKNCKRNTIYRYRVAAYKKIGSYTVTGKPSKTIKVKTKK